MWFEAASEVFCVEITQTRLDLERYVWSIPRKLIVVNTGVGFRRLIVSPAGNASSAVAAARKGMLHPRREETTMGRDEDEHERLFTLSEANHLIPQLNTRMACVRQAKAVLARTRDDIRRASARAEYGGGSSAGPLYISSLQQISSNLQAIQEMGILVKDVDLGLCDFPHLRDGRVVFLCWKYGEQEIKWWHETTTGYKDRCPLEGPV